LNFNVDARRGPQAPVLSTPELTPGLVRRTSTTDLRLPRREGEPLGVQLVGRDLVVMDDGSLLEEHQSVSLAVDADTKRIDAVASSPPKLLDDLLGTTVGPGFRQKIRPLRRWVGASLEGPTTCTHLNEALRALADIDHLLELRRRSDRG
jgi:hypothetical protein